MCKMEMISWAVAGEVKVIPKHCDFHVECENWGTRSFSSHKGVESGHARRRIKAEPPIGAPYAIWPSNSMSMPSPTDIHSHAKMPVL